jgi:hypothetical protein
MLINWKCSPKLYFIQGPILILLSAIPALNLLFYDNKTKDAVDRDEIICFMQVSYVQIALALINALIISGTYLLTTFSLITAITIIIYSRNQAIFLTDMKEVAFISLYVAFISFLVWQAEMRKKINFI